MNPKLFAPALLLLACAASAPSPASGQQPAKPRRVLDNLSLPSTPRPADAADGWQLFAPEGERFSVEMPGAPSDKSAGRPREAGHSYRVRSEGILYEVTRTDSLPKAMFALDGFEEDFLDSLSGSLVGSARREWPQMNLRLAGARRISLGGRSGREFELASAEYRSSVRACLVDGSLLIVAMTGPKSAFSEEKVSRFFSSLRLN